MADLTAELEIVWRPLSWVSYVRQRTLALRAYGEGCEMSDYSAFDVVAVAASHGGIQAVKSIVSKLPPTFPVPVIFLQHLGDWFPYSFPESIARYAHMPVKWAEHNERMKAGQIYIAPAGAHLSIDARSRFVLSHTPRVQFVRPSANVLFGSLAVVFKERLLGVVLTGCGSDGALGVSMIKTMGGYVLVQDEWSSAASGMPRAAIQTGCADLVLPLECIASALIALTMAPGAANLFTAGTLTNFAASSGRILPG